jgi:hypothetical protein
MYVHQKCIGALIDDGFLLSFYALQKLLYLSKSLIIHFDDSENLEIKNQCQINLVAECNQESMLKCLIFLFLTY